MTTGREGAEFAFVGLAVPLGVNVGSVGVGLGDSDGVGVGSLTVFVGAGFPVHPEKEKMTERQMMIEITLGSVVLT